VTKLINKTFGKHHVFKAANFLYQHNFYDLKIRNYFYLFLGFFGFVFKFLQCSQQQAKHSPISVDKTNHLTKGRKTSVQYGIFIHASLHNIIINIAFIFPSIYQLKTTTNLLQ